MGHGSSASHLLWEAKRESYLDVSGVGLKLASYCDKHLSRSDRDPIVFGSIVHDVMIRFFYGTRNSETLQPLCNYLDVGKDGTVNTVERLVSVMKRWIQCTQRDEATFLELLDSHS